jgi:hypothetical protein
MGKNRTLNDSGHRISHLPKAGSNYHAFMHPFFAEAYPKDLALTYIDPRSWSQGDRLALPIGRMASAHDVTQNELLLLCGYTGTTSYFSRFSGEPVLDSPLIPYTARETTLPVGFDSDIHFALHYEMDLAEAADGSKAKLPKPGGFSGFPDLGHGFRRERLLQRLDAGAGKDNRYCSSVAGGELVCCRNQGREGQGVSLGESPQGHRLPSTGLREDNRRI